VYHDIAISKLARMIAWILAAAIVILSVVPRDFRPVTAAPHHVEHFIIYFVTGIAFGLGYVRNHYLLALLLLLFCGFVELLQKLVPGRHARLSDFIVDAVATCIGLLAVSLISQIRARI
jgi:VanZ family protein